MHLRTGNIAQPCSYMHPLSSNAPSWKGLRLRYFLTRPFRLWLHQEGKWVL